MYAGLMQWGGKLFLFMCSYEQLERTLQVPSDTYEAMQLTEDFNPRTSGIKAKTVPLGHAKTYVASERNPGLKDVLNYNKNL